jgi:SAM-dependent methyltransferase
MRRDRLRATTNQVELAAGSRLVADLVAASYDRALREHARGRLLDMGCGKAPLYLAYKDRVTDVQCIDWANGLHGTNYLDKVCDLGGAIPYADGAFDTIILSDVLEHLAEPTNCWREMSRLLVPGGKVILNVPFYYPVHEAPHDFYRYTEFALRRFAENSGFEVIELTSVGGALEILADIISKLFAGAKLKPMAIGIQALALPLARSKVGRRIAKRTSERFPLGYSMVAVKAAVRAST